MTMDPFSDILKLVGAQSFISGGFAAGGPWALRFPAPDKLKFFALVKGACWLQADGDEKPVRVGTGDVFLSSERRSFVLASDLSVAPLQATRLFSDAGRNFATLGDGEDCALIGGHVLLDAVNGEFLASALPRLIHVRATSPHAAMLQWLLEKLVREQVDDLPGADIAAMQLAQLLFVQLLRAHLATSGSLPPGWLRAVGDPRLAPALRLMHGEPGRPWQLEELAQACAMSRTTFALHFKTIAGIAPLSYLTEWRMRLAERNLREGTVPIAVLGRSLGYTSESAFSNAFKRVMGNAPKRYRSNHAGPA